MPEQNERTTETQRNQEFCTIRIMFPVKSDEEAIDCKKKIAAAISDKPEAQTDFRITSMPLIPRG